MEAPEPETEEHRTPSKRAHHGAPPARSVAKRTRSKVEHDVGSSKRDKFESLVIELHDSPVRDTSLSFTTPAVGTVGPPLVPTTEVVLFSSPDFDSRTYRRKTTARRAKTVSLNVESSFGEVSSRPFKPLFVSLLSFFFPCYYYITSFSSFFFLFFLHWHIFLFAVSRPIDLVTVRESNLKSKGDSIDIIMGSGNLLLLALSSYVFVAIDGISIIGNTTNSSMVHTGTVETDEIGAAVDSSPVLSGVVDASIVERETGVLLLVLEEVTDDGATRGGATDPLLPPERVASAAEERIISEPIMPTSDLDPPQSRKTIGTASAAHASITSIDLCWVCLIKKKLPFFCSFDK